MPTGLHLGGRNPEFYSKSIWIQRLLNLLSTNPQYLSETNRNFLTAQPEELLGHIINQDQIEALATEKPTPPQYHLQ